MNHSSLLLLYRIETLYCIVLDNISIEISVVSFIEIDLLSLKGLERRQWSVVEGGSKIRRAS